AFPRATPNLFIRGADVAKSPWRGLAEPLGDEKSRANIFSELTEPLLAVAQRLYRPRPFEGRPETRGDIAHQLRLVRAPIPRMRVIYIQTGFPMLFVQSRNGDECADAEGLVYGGEIASSRIGPRVVNHRGLPGLERLAELWCGEITDAVFAHYAFPIETPTVPTFTNDRQISRRVYFDNFATGHAEVFAKPACRQPD